MRLYYRLAAAALAALVLAPTLTAQIVIRERVALNAETATEVASAPTVTASAGRQPGQSVSAYFATFPEGKRGVLQYYPSFSSRRMTASWGTRIEGTLEVSSSGSSTAIPLTDLFLWYYAPSTAYASACRGDQYLRYQSAKNEDIPSPPEVRVGPEINPANGAILLTHTLRIGQWTWENDNANGIGTGGGFGCMDSYGDECDCLDSIGASPGDLVGGKNITVKTRFTADDPDAFLVEAVRDTIAWGESTNFGALAVYTGAHGTYEVKNFWHPYDEPVLVESGSPYLQVSTPEDRYDNLRAVGRSVRATGSAMPPGDIAVSFTVRWRGAEGIGTVVIDVPDAVVADLGIDSDNDGAVTDDDDGIENDASRLGALVAYNTDDDNGDDVPDYDNDTGFTDDDLERITLEVEGDAEGDVTLSPLDGAAHFRVWTDAGRTEAVALPATWSADSLPEELYVEGVAWEETYASLVLEVAEGTGMPGEVLADTVRFYVGSEGLSYPSEVIAATDPVVVVSGFPAGHEFTVRTYKDDAFLAQSAHTVDGLFAVVPVPTPDEAGSVLTVEVVADGAAYTLGTVDADVVPGPATRLEIATAAPGGDPLAFAADEFSELTATVTAYDKVDNPVRDGTPIYWFADGDASVAEEVGATTAGAGTYALRAGWEGGELQSFTVEVDGVAQTTALDVRGIDIALSASTEPMYAGGAEQRLVTAQVSCGAGCVVPDGTPIQWMTTKGEITTDATAGVQIRTGVVTNGQATAFFTTTNEGLKPGTASVVAQIANNVGELQIPVEHPEGHVLTVTLDRLAIAGDRTQDDTILLDPVYHPTPHAVFATTTATIDGVADMEVEVSLEGPGADFLELDGATGGVLRTRLDRVGESWRGQKVVTLRSNGTLSPATHPDWKIGDFRVVVTAVGEEPLPTDPPPALTATSPLARSATTSGDDEPTVEVLVWNETFALPDGREYDDVYPSTWYTNEPAADVFAVKNDRFEARNTAVGALGVWQTNFFEIPEGVPITVSFRLACEGVYALGDDIQLSYSVNGQSPQTFFSQNGSVDDCVDEIRSSSQNIEGSTLRVLAEARAQGQDRAYFWDDVNVRATVNGQAIAQGLVTTGNLYAWTQEQVRQFAWGIVSGEGDNNAVLAAEVLLSFVPLVGVALDGRDAVGQLLALWPGGEDPDWALFTLAAIGIATEVPPLKFGVDQAVNYLKLAVRAVDPGPLRRWLFRGALNGITAALRTGDTSWFSRNEELFTGLGRACSAGRYASAESGTASSTNGFCIRRTLDRLGQRAQQDFSELLAHIEYREVEGLLAHMDEQFASFADADERARKVLALFNGRKEFVRLGNRNDAMTPTQLQALTHNQRLDDMASFYQGRAARPWEERHVASYADALDLAETDATIRGPLNDLLNPQLNRPGVHEYLKEGPNGLKEASRQLEMKGSLVLLRGDVPAVSPGGTPTTLSPSNVEVSVPTDVDSFTEGTQILNAKGEVVRKDGEIDTFADELIAEVKNVGNLNNITRPGSYADQRIREKLFADQTGRAMYYIFPTSKSGNPVVVTEQVKAYLRQYGIGYIVIDPY